MGYFAVLFSDSVSCRPAAECTSSCYRYQVIPTSTRFRKPCYNYLVEGNLQEFFVYNGLIDRYRQWMPLQATDTVITLQEGNTPLIAMPRLAAAISEHVTLYAKFDGMNPTGSFKDRGMTVAVSHAVSQGFKVVMCASTGNTSASAAAYAARAGVRCVVLIPGGKIALGKLSQAVAHGAKIIAIDGNFDTALGLVRELCNEHPIALVNSVNPFRIHGQKTAAFEVIDQLGKAPDYHALPVGNAGNITAIWQGYNEYKSAGLSDTLPTMLGFQAAGAAPIVLGQVVDNPETVATAIRIGNPASWTGALNARDQSNGRIESVTDEEILSAYRLLPSLEGIFVEPACAAPVAGLLNLGKSGYFNRPCVVVLTLTGHGLKDPDCALRLSETPQTVPADKSAVLKAIGL